MKPRGQFAMASLVAAGLGLLVLGQALPAAAVQARTNSLKLTFNKIPAGEFMQGSPASEPGRFTNETQHAVKITKSFWLATTHVTVGQFAAFAKDSGHQTLAEKQGWSYQSWNGSEKKWDKLEGGAWKNPGFSQHADEPVVCVTWHDATAFCDWLSAKEGRKYRLPTEAEWEYSSRAGQTNAYPWGNNPDDGAGWANGCDQVASNRFTLFPAFPWRDGFVHTSPVTTFRTNAWGLHDMVGNVLQWCGDWHGPYPAGAVENPQGPTEGKERVLRGGSFVYGPRQCRCAFRGRNSPEFQNFYVGFRVLMETETKSP